MLLAALCGVLLTGPVAYADVRTEEKSLVKFEGVLGRMMGIFGGRAARDGITTTVVVKGDRMATTSGNTQQIVDLKEEKIYDVDLKDKSYKVTTFVEIRQQMEEGRRKAAEQQQKESGKSSEPAREMEIDFDVKDTGQNRTVNGFSAREVLMTITMREKGKTLEQSGGLVLSNSMWLAPKIEGMSELADFQRRYAEKLLASAALNAQQMAALSAMYPQIQDAMARMRAEGVKLDGTAVMTDTRFETVANAQQGAQPTAAEKKAEAPPTSIGGLGGRLGRRILGGNKDDDKEATPATPGRATIMTMHHEVLKVTPLVTDADVASPASFKQKS